VLTFCSGLQTLFLTFSDVFCFDDLSIFDLSRHFLHKPDFAKAGWRPLLEPLQLAFRPYDPSSLPEEKHAVYGDFMAVLTFMHIYDNLRLAICRTV